MSKRPALVLCTVGMLLVLSTLPAATAQNEDAETPSSITRIMMLPPEAEVTGMLVDDNGHFFVNAMHPDPDHYKATVGVVHGVDWNSLPNTVPELDASSSPEDIWHGIRTSYGTYQVLLQSGDALTDGGVAGGIYAADDGALLFQSQKPDFNAFVPATADGERGFLYTAWEDRPAGISQLEIAWNATSSEWDVLTSSMLDLSGINGGWVLCFGSISPWGAPLFSEELYFDNTEEWNDESFRYHHNQVLLEDYLGHYPNPYDYGYIIEIEDADSAEPAFNRHLAMGRFSHENAQVMPDERTVYLTDDGYDTVLYKFIADVPGDLSAGTLYAAHLAQDQSRDAATTGFDVDWVELGASSSAEVQTWIDEYDGITTADFVAGESSYISDAEINDWAEARLNEDLNGDGTIGTAADDRVAFLESRKAAAALGATDEWNKMEGVAFNPEASNVLYLAMSSISNAMTDAQGDIDLTTNSCGIVYRMTMNTTWNVNRIDPAIVGGPYTSSAQYQCDIDNLAGPDNLLVLNDGRVLVGEDTWRHEHNTVWLWQAASSDVVGSEVLTANVTALSDDTADGALVHHAEMSNLQPGRTYTVNLLVRDAGSGEAEGQVNWRDITSESTLGEYTFSLGSGCYLAVTTLYEQVDADHRAGNATVLSESMQSLAVGPGECVDGQYIAPETSDGFLPGFGLPLTIIAALGALAVLQRKPR
ncbi:MAG: alkaline phosphatase PhoX [Candidatus Poseidoniaceae archaeon]